MIFHINLKIVKAFLSVFLFSQLIYCTSMTFFVLQLHFVKMKLNLKQKKCKKRTFCVLIIYCTFFFLLPLIGLQFHLNFRFACYSFPPFSHFYNTLTVTVANCYDIYNSTLGLMVEVKRGAKRRLTSLVQESSR